MFSKDLEHTIGQCYKRAREARHEFMTVEHLLLALLDNPSAQAVLKACGADAERLRQELEQAIEAEAQAQAICMQTQDFARAYHAFVAKQKTVFEGN